MVKHRLNNRYSWFKSGLDDGFHKRCLNFVKIIGPQSLVLNSELIHELLIVVIIFFFF